MTGKILRSVKTQTQRTKAVLLIQNALQSFLLSCDDKKLHQEPYARTNAKQLRFYLYAQPYILPYAINFNANNLHNARQRRHLNATLVSTHNINSFYPQTPNFTLTHALPIHLHHQQRFNTTSQRLTLHFTTINPTLNNSSTNHDYALPIRQGLQLPLGISSGRRPL